MIHIKKGIDYSESVRRERRKLVRMSHLVQKGFMKKEKVDECYASWKAHAGKENSFKLLQRMDKFYNNLWEVEENAKNNKKKINSN